ncbi:integrase arm-type DNA-binding domain-containing protein [Celeribacter halophilus]|uniref:Integrase arm-type DNA-binding domain-containing protein n=1 Tax=Celeribacter halophilus TaxID=576117 RepID=A0AAW7XMK2_9RHOB|nr:integrase arm-type DNA-binding domain-containing protein [Celeribacter halophilus]MDO6455466.1 integrase arm-type DNA-binding domain-containing protein [Celeribacter halophilus]
MPRKAKELSAVEVRRLEHPGKGGNKTFAVGGVDGLLLQVTPTGAKSWLIKTTVAGTRRNIGLGSYPSVTLSQARDRAREIRDMIWQGIDPVEHRKATRAALAAAQRRGLTFADAVGEYCEAKLDQFRNEKHQKQWRSTLENYAVPEIGKMLVDDIQVQDVLRVLEPIWTTKTETASRLRGRIEAVLSWATVAGHRTGDNPARWRGNLKELLPAPTKVKRGDNQPAIALDDAGRWFKALRQREGFGARALEFLTLCAARSGEIRGATWDEIDLDKGLWIVPAARMKMDRKHRVPLSPAAVDLLQALPRIAGNPLVFPAQRGGQLSDATLSATMKRIHAADLDAGGVGFFDEVSKRPAVPHGLRSTFRDWAAERTDFPGDMAEIALAHKVGSAVEAAYRRNDMVEKRRDLMKKWAEFLC